MSIIMTLVSTTRMCAGVSPLPTPQTVVYDFRLPTRRVNTRKGMRKTGEGKGKEEEEGRQDKKWGGVRRLKGMGGKEESEREGRERRRV